MLVWILSRCLLRGSSLHQYQWNCQGIVLLNAISCTPWKVSFRHTLCLCPLGMPLCRAPSPFCRSLWSVTELETLTTIYLVPARKGKADPKCNQRIDITSANIRMVARNEEITSGDNTKVSLHWNFNNSFYTWSLIIASDFFLIGYSNPRWLEFPLAWWHSLE